MQYLVSDRQGNPLACVLFGAAAWQCRARDEHIGWDAATRARGLAYVTNNTRFLILPWVRVPHLASHVLKSLHWLHVASTVFFWFIRKGRAEHPHRKLGQRRAKQDKAIADALSIRPGLQVYFTAARVEIDNNLFENAIRPSAVGKKNWLFIGTAEAGKKTAVPGEGVGFSESSQQREGLYVIRISPRRHRPGSCAFLQAA